MTTMREVTWGEALVVAAFRHDGGLREATRRIHSVIGEHIGTRNTFAKLLRLNTPEGLASKDLFRAWLLLTAFGEDAPEWGVSDDVVPAGYDRAHLRSALDPSPEGPGSGRVVDGGAASTVGYSRGLGRRLSPVANAA